MSERKKRKMDENEDGQTKGYNFKDLTNFQLDEILQDNADRKMIFLKGTFPSISKTDPAVVILDKTPFSREKVGQILKNPETHLELEFINDVYGKYHVSLPKDLNSVKASVIYPASEKHVEKYRASRRYIIEETPQLYRIMTRPFLKSEKFPVEWVYNILNHKKETESIIEEDLDPENGFVLVPDYKWNGKQVEDLYLICIVRNEKIGSIRDLNASHLSMLRSIWRRCTAAIRNRYGVPYSQIRAYFHYQPSYYHLHIHFSHVAYDAPGIQVERAHLLKTVIDNLRACSDFYKQASLCFEVKESDKLYKYYKDAGYDFEGTRDKGEDCAKLLDFFRKMGGAKHEPCGEHWDMSYGDSAWRMAVMALCLPACYNRRRLAKIALSSGFTSMGDSTDHYSEWPEKLEDVRKMLFESLPFIKAVEMFDLYNSHVNARRGLELLTEEDLAYRKLIEFEETLLQWDELRREGESVGPDSLLDKMCDVGFPGSFKYKNIKEKTELQNLLTFFLNLTKLCFLKRTGWVRHGVRDPERVAGHMFRMGVMAIALEEPTDHLAIKDGSSVILSIVHDIAECIVGDITPKDNVSPEDKHEREMAAMKQLVSNLPDTTSLEFFEAFQRYEFCSESDKDAILTKDLDKFDMILQAFEYEQIEAKYTAICKKEKVENPLFLQEFFDSTRDIFRTIKVKQFVELLNSRRAEFAKKFTSSENNHQA